LLYNYLINNGIYFHGFTLKLLCPSGIKQLTNFKYFCVKFYNIIQFK
jgi:hypothetical protein